MGLGQRGRWGQGPEGVGGGERRERGTERVRRGGERGDREGERGGGGENTLADILVKRE